MAKDKYQLEVDQNYQWFIDHRLEIIKEHPKKIGHFVLIKNQELIGLYKTYQEIIVVANNMFKNEPFSIQELLKDEVIHNLGSTDLTL